MKKEITQHTFAYAVLIAGFLMFLALFLAVWPDRTLLRIVGAALVIFYFSWGVVTHVKTTTLTTRVAIEYGAVALLGGIFLLMITF